MFEKQPQKIYNKRFFLTIFGLRSWKSEHSPPTLEKSLFKILLLVHTFDHLPPLKGAKWSSRCSGRGRAAIRSTGALPNRPRRAKVGPEGAQNLVNNAFRVFLVFCLGR